MDSVRFGRALGIGARAAAKTLVTAVDAATSPNPSTTGNAKPGIDPTPVESKAAASGARLGEHAAQKAAQLLRTGEGLKRGSKNFGHAVLGPVVKLSGVLWLELTGVFFGIFALFATGAAWKLRGELLQATARPDSRAHFWWATAMAVVFAYFCVTSFVNANRRSRGR